MSLCAGISLNWKRNRIQCSSASNTNFKCLAFKGAIKGAIKQEATPFITMSSKTNKTAMKTKHDENPEGGEEEIVLKTPVTPGRRTRNNSYQQALKPGQENNSRDIPESIQEESPRSSSADDEMGSIENLLPPHVLIRKDELAGKSNAHKLDAVYEACNSLYNMYHAVNKRMQPLEYAVFNTDKGILPQLQGIVDHAKDADKQVDMLRKENLELRAELEIVKGTISKQHSQLGVMNRKIADLTARTMSDNVTINGILNDSTKEDSKEVTKEFLQQKLQLQVRDKDLIKAHRLGSYQGGKNRAMVLKCKPALQKAIFENTAKLADKTNEEGNKYSVNKQLPDSLAEKRRENRQIIREKQKQEEHLDGKLKSTFLVRNNNVFINGQLQRKLVVPPTPDQLFLDPEEQERVNNMKLYYSDTKPYNHSEFTAVAVATPTLNAVHLAYIKLYQTHPYADHIVVAFDTEHQQGYNDDGEHSSGYKLLQVLRDNRAADTTVFMIRRFGGVHIGPMRFTIMKEQAIKALRKLGV